MAPLRPLHTLMLSLFATLQISFASAIFGVERIPLGGSLFQIEARGLESRDDKGSDCDADPDYSLVDLGCKCGFRDGSWIDLNSSAASTTTPTPTGPQPRPSPVRPCKSSLESHFLLA